MATEMEGTEPDPFAAEERESQRLQVEYRRLAREALDRGKALLEQKDEASLRHAALEFRHAFEALVYDNALRFTDELVGEDYAVWQPTQLLERLLEIDPVADLSLEMRLQDPATGEWLSLGHDRRISLRALKKCYFALGNHLHTPSLAQMKGKGFPKPAPLRRKCNESVELIERDLSANMRIGRLAIFGHFDIKCQQCGTLIRRRLNALRTPANNRKGTKESVQAKCPNCPASFEIRSDDGQNVLWRGEHWEGNCPHKDCEGVHVKWAREVKDGMKSACPECGRTAVFTQAFSFFPEEFLARIRKPERERS